MTERLTFTMSRRPSLRVWEENANECVQLTLEANMNRPEVPGDRKLHRVLLPISVLNPGSILALHRQFELDW